MDDMSPIKWTDKLIFGIVIVLTILAFAIAIAPARQDGYFRSECESNNGIAIKTLHFENICIKKTAVIDL